MLTLQRLDALVNDRFAGDKGRLLELFDTSEVFDVLRAYGQPSDWYHFEPKTFDGEYLVATPTGFQVYRQERGSRTGMRDFKTLREAAHAVFG